MTNETTPSTAVSGEETVSLSRRSALMKLGLATVAVYAAPALVTLSEAEAGRKSGKNSGKNSGRKSRNSKKSKKSKKSRKTRKSKKSKKTRKSRKSRKTGRRT
ncbi:hypothetical protein [Rhizobium sp.]